MLFEKKYVCHVIAVVVFVLNLFEILLDSFCLVMSINDHIDGSALCHIPLHKFMLVIGKAR